MNRLILATAIVCFTVCNIALAQMGGFGGPPGPPGAFLPQANTIPEAAQKLEDTVLPDFSVDKTTLTGVVDLLRKMVPGFNVVIINIDQSTPDNDETFP